MGITDSRKVRLSNLVVASMAQIFHVLMSKNIRVIIEQPINSRMYQHAALEKMVANFPGFLIASTWMGVFGHGMPKPTRLLTNMRTSRLLARKINCQLGGVASPSNRTSSTPSR